MPTLHGHGSWHAALLVLDANNSPKQCLLDTMGAWHLGRPWSITDKEYAWLVGSLWKCSHKIFGVWHGFWYGWLSSLFLTGLATVLFWTRLVSDIMLTVVPWDCEEHICLLRDVHCWFAKHSVVLPFEQVVWIQIPKKGILIYQSVQRRSRRSIVLHKIESCYFHKSIGGLYLLYFALI